MTKTFERFLRSFSDEELATFARERSRVRPPYWRFLSMALRIESDRRGLGLEEDVLDATAGSAAKREARRGSA